MMSEKEFPRRKGGQDVNDDQSEETRDRRLAKARRYARELEERNHPDIVGKKKRKLDDGTFLSFYTKEDFDHDFGEFLEQEEESRIQPPVEFFVRLTYDTNTEDAAVLYEGFLSTFYMEDDDGSPVSGHMEMHELGVMTLFLGRHKDILGDTYRTGMDENATFDVECLQPWPEERRKEFLERVSFTLLYFPSNESMAVKQVVTTRGYQGSRRWLAMLRPYEQNTFANVTTVEDDGDDDDTIVNVGFYIWQKHSFAIKVQWGPYL